MPRAGSVFTYPEVKVSTRKEREEREAEALLNRIERAGDKVERRMRRAGAVKGSMSAWPVGRPPIDLNITLSLPDVPLAELEAELDGIIKSVMGRIVGAAATAVEQALGVPLLPPPADLPWFPMQEAGVDETALRAAAEAAGHDPDQFGSLAGAKVYRNDRYQVFVRPMEPFAPEMPAMVHASISRIDRAACHDWRDLQRIKNDIFGPECEAVELYPAETRLVDAANQYHLWVIPDPKLRFPFGFSRRATSDEIPAEAALSNARQRPGSGSTVAGGTQADAPWSAEQVANLNKHQASPHYHPFTCGGCEAVPECREVLVATEAGWKCPNPACSYTQKWALAGIANGALPEVPAWVSDPAEDAPLG